METQTEVNGFRPRPILFFLKNNSKYRATLEQGSLFITSKLFVNKLLSSQIEDEMRNVESMPIWDFFNVSKVLLFNEGIVFVVSRLGKAWCLDDATTGRERENFVRVCIEI